MVGCAPPPPLTMAKARKENLMSGITWVYIKTEPSLWTVGFYDPNGKWHSDSDADSPEEAANRCHFLNGGAPQESGKPECLAGECTYYSHYLVCYDPGKQGAKLDHIAYHHAEQECSKAQQAVEEWYENHPRPHDYSDSAMIHLLENQVTFWESRIAA